MSTRFCVACCGVELRGVQDEMKKSAQASNAERLKSNGRFGFISLPLFVVYFLRCESTYKLRATRFVVVLRGERRYYRCLLDLGGDGINPVSEK